MRRFIFSLFIVMIFGLQGTALTQECGNGTINGQVVNDTAGGGSVSGLEVNLITYVDDEMRTTATTTDEAGKFQFNNLQYCTGKIRKKK